MKYLRLLMLLLVIFNPTVSMAKHRIYHEVGIASWYGPWHNGKKTANGERFNQNALTCAHKRLPLNSIIRVTNTKNHKSVILRVNDRGPYRKHRILDVSKRAAEILGFKKRGTTKVKIQVLTMR